MALEDVRDWVSRAERAVGQALEGFVERNGYEPDEQFVKLTSSDVTVHLPSAEAQAFFSVVEEVSWPDLWNGYFLGPYERVASDYMRGVRKWQAPDGRRDALAIGSDGGGAFFVIDLLTGKVLRIDEAFVRKDCLHGVGVTIAKDLDDFLELLLQSVAAIAAGERPHF